MLSLMGYIPTVFNSKELKLIMMTSKQGIAKKQLFLNQQKPVVLAQLEPLTYFSNVALNRNKRNVVLGLAKITGDLFLLNPRNLRIVAEFEGLGTICKLRLNLDYIPLLTDIWFLL
jgi:hypothetical protein